MDLKFANTNATQPCLIIRADGSVEFREGLTEEEINHECGDIRLAALALFKMHQRIAELESSKPA